MRARIASLAFTVTLSACARAVPVVQIALPPAPTPALHEADVPAVDFPYLEVVDLQETPNPALHVVELRGEIKNSGTAATHSVTVRVEGRDVDGAVMVQVDAIPSTERIPAGGSATFTVFVDDHPAVVRYHVRTLAK